MRGQGEEATCMCWRFGDAVMCFLFCNWKCCLHLCKQGEEKVNIAGQIQERETGMSRFWLYSKKKLMGFQLQLSCVFTFQYKSWKRSKCPTNGRKENNLWRSAPARPATWPVRTQFDFYVVGSVPRTLNNAALSGMLHRVPARWGPESTQLEGKLCRSPTQINK